ncbi:MAG: TIM barrel protein, partial [Deltaproteobacteria bacterium]|nr:TIM barrel protein [Deltaproteobacteria bacterium]
MTLPVNIHIPYFMLLDRFAEILSKNINPEIYLSAEALDALTSEDLEKIKSGLDMNSLRCSVHGPYMDISPGATDEKARGVARQRFIQLFQVLRILKPISVVLHADYDARRYDDDEDLWFEQSIKTWQEFIDFAEDIETVICIENVFEERPHSIKRLMEHYSSDFFRVCLD